MNAHVMTVETRTENETLFGCPLEGCGRRLVVDRSGRLAVLDQGDFFAFHSGGTASSGGTGEGFAIDADVA